MGLVPEKTSGWSLITHLSYPPGNSVNEFIDEPVQFILKPDVNSLLIVLQYLYVDICSKTIYTSLKLIVLYCHILYAKEALGIRISTAAQFLVSSPKPPYDFNLKKEISKPIVCLSILA
jgi:hypothetical protein